MLALQLIRGTGDTLHVPVGDLERRAHRHRQGHGGNVRLDAREKYELCPAAEDQRQRQRQDPEERGDDRVTVGQGKAQQRPVIIDYKLFKAIGEPLLKGAEA